jgi:integrase
MAKRGHGEGSITQRVDDSRWMARLMVDGRRKTVYGATRKEVQDKLDRLKREMTQGTLSAR